MNLRTGETLHVAGRLLRSHVGEHLAIEHQFVALQLPDGQTIETNIRNLVTYSASKQASAVDVVQELADMRAKYAQCAKALDASHDKVFALQSDLKAAQELLQASEARLAQVKTGQSTTKKK